LVVSGDFAGGISDGVDAIAAVVRGEPLPEPTAAPAPGSDFSGLLVMVLIGAAFIGGLIKRALGTLPGALVTGGITGFVTWLVVGVLGMAVFAGFIGFMLTLFTAAGPGR